MKRITVNITIFIMLLFCSCQNQKVKQKHNISNIALLEQSSILEGWTDEGNFWLLKIVPQKIIYEFDMACDYTFDSKIIDNKIIIFWGNHFNCPSDRRLSRKYSDIKNPVEGLPFGEIAQTSDSTLIVKYYYEDWVEKINKEERNFFDKLFPTEFKKINL